MQVPQALSAELLAFLDDSLDSLEKVEAAWQLANANAPVRVSELQARVQLAKDGMDALIRELQRARVVELDGGPDLVKLGPRADSPEFARLMKLYADDRVTVLSALTRIAMERIRSMAARTFAEAFVLRKRRGDDG